MRGDPVAVVELSGEARAYPLAILVWHEDRWTRSPSGRDELPHDDQFWFALAAFFPDVEIRR